MRPLPRTRDSVRPTLGSAGARFVAWSSTPSGLVALFAAGFVLRLWLARGGGFPFDMQSFAGWAGRLADKGPWRFYPKAGENFFVDYPPGYLYVLYVAGKAARAIGQGAPSVFLLKLPPILGDLGLAWVVGALAARLAPEDRNVSVRGVAAAAILFNPAIFFVSAVWGQADSIFALLLVGGFLLLGEADARPVRESIGAALVAAAIVTKPQALFVVPVVILVLAWRHLRARGSTVDGLARLALVGASAGLAGLVLITPFRMSPVQAFSFYASAAKTYPQTSVFAFNLWGAVGFWRPDSGRGAVRIFGLPAGVLGVIVFAVVAGLVLVRAWRALENGERQDRVLAFGGIAITLVAFATLTRIHERYLYLAVAFLVAFVAWPKMRRALLVLSALYFVNVYYPYVYYLRYVHRPAPDLGGAFDAFYGRDIAGFRLRFLSLTTGVVSLVIAAAGWRWLRTPDAAGRGLFSTGVAEATVPRPEPELRPPWTLRLYPVGRSGALLAIVVFAIAFVSRVAGLGHPPGMYFDEVYHARTGAEYLNHKEVYEWTHPPLAKELIGLSIKGLSGFRSTPLVALRAGVSPRLITSATAGNVWAVPDASGVSVQRGFVDGGCRLRAVGSAAHADVAPEAIAASESNVFVAGVGGHGRVLVRMDGSREAWRTKIERRVKRITALGAAAYVLQDDGTLVSVSSAGKATAVAKNVTALAATAADSVVWAASTTPSRISSWDALGKRTASVEVTGFPRDIAVPESTKRVVVAYASTDRAQVIDTEASNVNSTLGGPAWFAGTVPETQLAWIAGSRTMQFIEPRGGSVLGRVPLPATVQSLVAEPRSHRMLAVSAEGIACVSGRPTFAWRFGSAVTGGLMVAFVALLALRLFGSTAIAALAALFLTVDGLAFTISRIAMNDSYVTAFVLVAWFCALSALYRWGLGPADARSRPAAIGWLAASGLFGGAALASKWVGLYAIGAIVLLVGWDVTARGRASIVAAFGNTALGLVLLSGLLIVVPVAVYIASYIPYFTLGHSFGDFASLQQQMYAYHANLKATHPFGSPWYGWPLGHRAVFLYLANHGLNRSEIWTIPNIVVLWGGLVGMAVAAARAVRIRSVALLVVAGAALAQYLPWTVVSRVTFLYHYLPVVPFLAIALSWWLLEGLREYRYRRLVAVLVTLAALTFFFAVLPALEGWSVSGTTLNTIRQSLPWILPP